MTFDELTKVDKILYDFYLSYWDLEYGTEDSDPTWYCDMSELSDHIVQRMRIKDTEFLPSLFTKIEYILSNCDSFIKELIVIGFFESLQSRSNQYNYNFYTYFDKWLGPKSKQSWDDLIDYWEGKEWRNTKK